MQDSAISTCSFGPSAMTYCVISNLADTVHIRLPVVSPLTLTGMPVTTSKPLVSTTHHVGYCASPHPSSMQHHNELQTAVCGSIVLDHLLFRGMRVIETMDGRAGRRHVN